MEEPNPHPKVSKDSLEGTSYLPESNTIKTLHIETLDMFAMVVVEREIVLDTRTQTHIDSSEIKLKEMSRGIVERDHNFFATYI